MEPPIYSRQMLQTIGRELVLVVLTAGAVTAGLWGLPKISAQLFGSPAAPNLPAVGTGTTIRIAGVPFSSPTLNVVLITSPTCSFCLASADFHRQLSEKARERHLGFYIAVPSERRARQYIREAGLVGTIAKWSDLSFGFQGTPTVLLVDGTGNVRATLVGRLPNDTARQVLRILDHPEELATAIGLDGREVIGNAALSRLKSQRAAALIDVRERSDFGLWHKETAINIPLMEFDARASFELDKDALVVLDCSHFSGPTCRSIVERIRRHGFSAVAFSEGMVFNSCEVSRRPT